MTHRALTITLEATATPTTTVFPSSYSLPVSLCYSPSWPQRLYMSCSSSLLLSVFFLFSLFVYQPLWQERRKEIDEERQGKERNWKERKGKEKRQENGHDRKKESKSKERSEERKGEEIKKAKERKEERKGNKIKETRGNEKHKGEGQKLKDRNGKTMSRHG